MSTSNCLVGDDGSTFFEPPFFFYGDIELLLVIASAAFYFSLLEGYTLGAEDAEPEFPPFFFFLSLPQ